MADVEFVESKGVHVPQFLKKAISCSKVCYFNSFYFNKYQRPIKFNKQTYDSLRHLVETYKAKPEYLLNYNGTREHAEDFERLMDKYIQLGILREASAEELQSEDLFISPLNCLKTGENKFSILLHWVGNPFYGKPKMQLTAIAEEGDILQKYSSLRCEDLKSCYHQYSLTERSVLASGCRFRGKVWLCQTMMYGPAPCVIIESFG